MKKMKKSQDEKLSSLRFVSNKFKIVNVIKYLFYYFDLFCMFFIRGKKKSYDKKQVLIIANLGLGDAMNFLSVTDKYRKLYDKKHYEITLVVSKGLDLLFKEETDFDRVMSVNFNECVFSIKARLKLFKLLTRDSYDILIDGMGITGTSINMYVSNIVRAKEKITIVNEFVSNCPKFFLKRIYTKVFFINEKKMANVDYYNRFVAMLMDKKKYDVVYHKTKDYDVRVELPLEYYIVFPSASANVKKWPMDRYAELMERIYEKTKLPVLFCGTELDLDSVNELLALTSVPYVNIIGKTNVLEFIQVIKKAKFVITNDTSSYHIALNEEIPVAIITGGYTYDAYVTYDFPNNRYKKPYVIVDKRDCFNCWFKCPYMDGNSDKWPCLDAITVDDAWKIVSKMIDECDK